MERNQVRTYLDSDLLAIQVLQTGLDLGLTNVLDVLEQQLQLRSVWNFRVRSQLQKKNDGVSGICYGVALGSMPCSENALPEEET